MADSNARSGILAGGNWIIDHVKILNTWPAQDALANILSEATGNGGSPYNILKDLSRLGARFPLSAAGLIGDDSDGQLILSDCSIEGIDTSQLQRTKSAPTSYSDVMTDQSTGRRTFFHQRGANALLGPEHFDFTRSNARIFHLGYLLLLDRLDTIDAQGATGASVVLRAARSAGMRTSLDCVSDISDRFRAIATPALPHVDYFFANDFEAGRLTGVKVDDCDGRDLVSLRKAARSLLDAGVHAWVFIHSPHGIFAASPDEDIWQPSLRVPQARIKGAAGAGDALAAGILYGLHEKWSMSDCLRLGVSAAAASLFDATCSASVVSAEECLKLASELGFNSVEPHRHPTGQLGN
ncbi:MAG: hypothetical protein RIQ93_2599 [Verrucomicrobiota bacterium]|jgi:sugar/nucleoside kinase (ribokinase family)